MTHEARRTSTVARPPESPLLSGAVKSWSTSMGQVITGRGQAGLKED